MHKLTKHSGFTLAEVLITLAIIGVVAALTIPTVMHYFQEKVLLTQFEKVYSEIQQAYMQASQENGTADTWDTTAAGDGTITASYTYMKPYFKIMKDCPEACSWNTKLTTLAGSNGGYLDYNLYLVNGATIRFVNHATNIIGIAFDTNGANPPNQWGSDYFVLKLTSRDGAPLVEAYGTSLSQCTKGSDGGWYGGMSCPYWIIKHQNMDYLHRNLTAAEWDD